MKNKNKKASSVSPEITAVYQGSPYGTDAVFHALLRYLILLTSVIGMAVSAIGMLGLKVGAMDVILTSAYTFTTFYFLFKSLKGLIGGAVFGLAGGFAALKILGLDIKELFIGGFNGIFNSVLDVIKSRGYTTVPYLDTTHVTGFGMLLLITLPAALVVGLTSRRRTRVIPYAVTVLIPAFIFMLTGGEAQLRYFAPAVMSAVAMAVTELSEKGAKSVFRSSFNGFAALVLAGLLMLTPIVNTATAMKEIYLVEIGGISEILDPYGNSQIVVRRSTSPKKRLFNGQKIMTVYSTSSAPLYLRTWTGGYYGSESWYATDYDYGYSYGDFVRGNDYFDLTKDFLSKAQTLGYDAASIGVNLTGVLIEVVKKQKSLPLPSMSAAISTLYDDGKTQYAARIYDGVMTIDRLWKGSIVTSAVVFESESKLLSDVIYGYFEYLVGYGGHDRFPTSSIGKRFASRFYKYGNDAYIEISQKYTSFAKSAYGYGVDDEAIDRAVAEIVEKYDILEYFDRSYPADTVSATVTNGIVYNGYIYKLNNLGMAHASEIGAIVAEYLADGRKYTTNPRSTGKSVTEELLFGSREGYCVQFATVGTLIMRRLGYYARYAEGYLAQDFKQSKNNNGYAYEQKISDKEGHAWTEVWVDGFGWMTLEMTPGQGGYDADDTTTSPITTTPPETSDSPITTPPDTTPPQTDTTEPPVTTTPPETSIPVTTEGGEKGDGGGRQFDPLPLILITAAIIIPTVLVSSYLISTAAKRKKRLDGLIMNALRGTHNSEEIRLMSISLSRALSLALGAYGILPRAGELPESYGLRLEKELKLNGLDVPLSSCVNALVKQAYGFGMDENDIKVSAFTLSALRKNALRRVGIFKFVIYRIRGVI